MLELLGLAFLVILGCLAFVGITVMTWFRARMKEALVVKALEDSLAQMPVPQLQDAQSLDWYHPSQANSLSAEFEKLGARITGEYSIPEVNDTRVQLLRFNIPPAFVAINDHPDVGCWTDVVMLPQEGGTITYSTVPESREGTPRPAEHVLIQVEPSAHPASLLGYARSRALAGAFLPVFETDFVALFNEMMQNYHKTFETQDLDQSFLENIARESGVSLYGEEAASINAERRLLRHQEVVDACLQAYAKSSGLSALQWEQMRNGLLVIHDGLSREALVELLFESLELPDGFESELVKLEFTDKPARLLASGFNSLLPESMGMIKVATITSPVTADIYRVQLARAA